MSQHNGPDHVVTVTTYPYRHLETDGTYTDVVDVDHDMEHPADCDTLKYGELCALDQFLNGTGFEYSGIPNEPGTYVVSYWGSGPDHNGEYDAGVDVEARTEPPVVTAKSESVQAFAGVVDRIRNIGGLGS